MNVHERPSGGRLRAHRLFVILAIIGSGLAQAGGTSLAGATEPPQQVTVREEEGVYRVAARFRVPHPACVAFAVLTDYEQIPRFMPDVRTSIVRERFPGGALVEQEAVARIMLFSKRVHLLLDVRTDGETVRFSDESGRSFSSYEGSWRVARREGQTVITYELSAQPRFAVPEFLLTRILKRDAGRMIERLREEIAARPR